jgi:structural maintenance of chromosome 3 (chondroitin sulfate proteoglycan 6)
VDNEGTASKLIDQMAKEKSGRVTFMPLNRLKSHTVTYPKADDAVPLISKIRFDRQYAMAFEQVFGRTVVCPDLAIAATYTRSHGLNAITLDGDRVDRKGSLTGGYHDVRRSRLDAIKASKTWRAAYEKDSARHEQVKAEITRLEQAISLAIGKGQVLEAKRKQLIASRSSAASKVSWAEREAAQARDRVDRLRGVLQDAEAVLKDARTKRESYEEEIKTPMRQNLSDEELAAMEQLSKDLDEQKRTVVELSRGRADVRELEPSDFQLILA